MRRAVLLTLAGLAASATTATGCGDGGRPGSRGQLALGQETYTRECSRCHMIDGAGVPGVFPALAGDPIVRLPRAEVALDFILEGRRAMPGFGGQLPGQELAAVATYIRRSWGNHASAVGVDQVK